MANVLSSAAKEKFATGALNWNGDTIKVVLLSASYIYSSTHDNLDDVGAGARIATQTLGTKTATGGVCDSADPTFPSVASGSTVTQCWLYKDSGVESTSTLIAYFNVASGLSLVTNGTNISISVDNSTGWFSL